MSITWKELKKKYKKIELAKFLAEEYIEYGTYEAIARKYGTEHANVSSAINYHAEKLKVAYPQTYKEFKEHAYMARGRNTKKIRHLGGEKWKEIKDKYKGIERVRFVMREVVEEGSLGAFGEKYGVSTSTLCKMISYYRDELNTDYPEELARYKAYAGYATKKNPYHKPLGNKFSSKVFENLSKEILDSEFLDFVDNYYTGELSSIQLIEMAKEKGIRVYELNNDGKKKFIV
ncbi:hypothetical protein GCM10008908_24430 [Clostridium subterminale]|uniref:Uncharacterized protein n=1 Tax=Clostridium subterminale TaxID=1550 RepID=A0ABN1KRX2_CLOSU